MPEVQEKSPVSVLTYHADSSAEELLNPELPLPQPEPGKMTWINVDNAAQSERLQEFRKQFGLHTMVVDDLRSDDQRPKLEEFPNYLLIVLHTLIDKADDVENEQFNLIIGENFLLTFQEKPNDRFDALRKKIEGGGRVRKRGSDYLAYMILDTITRQNMRLLEKMEEEGDALEEELLQNEQAYRIREAGTLRKIYQLRTRLSRLRQLTRPVRELITGLLETESNLIEDRTKVYLRDTLDQIRYLSDNIESVREMMQGLIDLHMSQVNNRMSEIMKVLAMISTIFMPLNLIAAVYGMNFKFMPELEVKGFYFGVLGAMAVLAFFMFLFFRRKRWI